MGGNITDNHSLSVPEMCLYKVTKDLRDTSEELIKEKYFYSYSESLVIITFYPALLSFGLLGNLAFLFIVARLPSMRTITNMYLINIAVADLLFIITMIYDVLAAYLFSPAIKSSPYSNSIGCMVVNAAIYLSHFVSVFLILLVSTERYLAICKPLHHRSISTKNRTFKLFTLSWIVALLCTIFVAPHFGKLEQTCILLPNSDIFKASQLIVGSCSPSHWIFDSIPFIIQPIPFVITSVVISLMYYRIIKEMRVRSTLIEGTDSRNFDFRKQKVRNRVSVLLVTTAVIFFICSLPYFTLRVNDAILIISDNQIGFKLDSYNYGIVLQVVRGLGVVNSVINPVIYSATSPKYRHAFMYVFTCGNRNTQDW